VPTLSTQVLKVDIVARGTDSARATDHTCSAP